jgi:hypothetical protein
MTTLDTPATLITATHMHIESAHLRAHDGQILLHLCCNARFGQAATTIGARPRQRDIDALVHGRWRSSMRMSAVPPTWSTSGPTGPGDWRTLRERGRLPSPGASRGVQLPLQTLVIALQALTGALRFFELATQTIDFTIEIGQRWRRPFG